MTYLLPTSPITNEAEATKAARASAIAILIGVIYGVFSIILTWTSMAAIKAAATASAAASAQPGGPDAAMVAEVAVQSALWMGVGFTMIQAILAFVQWRRPNKIIAIIFLCLIAFGILSTLASVAMMSSGAIPTGSAPTTPMWQIVLGLVVMVVEAVLHITGLKGISKLDKIQMEAANAAY